MSINCSYRVVAQKVFLEPLKDAVARLVGENALVEVGALTAGGLVVVVGVQGNFPES